MSRTFTLKSVSTMTAIDQLNPATVAPKFYPDDVFSFIPALDTIPQARRSVMWNIVNGLNARIIGQLQAHLRREEAAESQNAGYDALFAQMDQATIDKWNEQRARIDELLTERQQHEELGLENQPTNLELAEAFVEIRSWLAQKMEAFAVTKRDLAQPIIDSIVYRQRQVPTVNEKQIDAIVLLTKIDRAELVKAQLTVLTNERQRFIEMAPRIAEMAESLTYSRRMNDSQIVGVFDGLPVHTQYQLYVAVCRALKNAGKGELQALLRFARQEAVGNKIILDHVLDGYYTKLDDFAKEYGDKLLDAYDRGVNLPTPDELKKEA